MAAAAQPPFGVPTEVDDPSSARANTIARYRHLRSISKRIHTGAVMLISEDTLLKQAARLGFKGPGKTILMKHRLVLDYLYDLLIYTAATGRSRPIDRCAHALRLAPGSEDDHVLQAMRQARFAILHVERRHEVAGLWVTDRVRGGEVWLLDLGMEETRLDGSDIATRLYTPAEFSVTSGVMVPIDDGLLHDLHDELPQFADKHFSEVIEDRRLAEKIYRLAFDQGIMDAVGLRPP